MKKKKNGKSFEDEEDETIVGDEEDFLEEDFETKFAESIQEK